MPGEGCRRACYRRGVQGKRQEQFAVLALLVVTMVWGSTFVVVKDGIAQMSLWSLMSWRWIIAVALLVAIRPRSIVPGRAVALRGLGVGAISALGYLFQTVGLLTVNASVSGFITGMFVVITPLIASVIFRERVAGAVWVGVVMAAFGLAAISLDGFSISVGALWTLACAAMWSLQILSIGRWSTPETSYSIAVFQLIGVAVFFSIGAAIEGFQAPPNAGVWAGIVILSVFASAFAMTVQTWGQTKVDATRAAVIFTMEPVFAGVFGVWIAHDPVTPRIALGAALILGAMLISEFGPKRSRIAEDLAQPHLTT